MTPCLTPDEFVDLVDGALAADRHAHLQTCAACAAAAAQVQAALALAVSAAVPEPSPLFWPAVNARVRAAIAESTPARWRAWLRWDVLVPMAGLAALVVVLASAVDRGMPAPARAPAVVDAAPDIATIVAADDDDALAMMVELADSLPDGGFDALGVTALPEIGEAAAVLSADEQRALAALLTSAMDRPTS